LDTCKKEKRDEIVGEALSGEFLLFSSQFTEKSVLRVNWLGKERPAGRGHFRQKQVHGEKEKKPIQWRRIRENHEKEGVRAEGERVQDKKRRGNLE